MNLTAPNIWLAYTHKFNPRVGAYEEEWAIRLWGVWFIE
jgi:hypothetical protein